MKLVIAEKPSVAQAIAKVLGANKRCEGYLEGNEIKEINANEDYSEFEVVIDNPSWKIPNDLKKELENLGKLYQWFAYNEERDVNIQVINN